MDACHASENDKSAEVAVSDQKIVEVAFKAGRIGIFANKKELDIKPENHVVVAAEKGVDLGKVIQVGAAFGAILADENIKEVLRIATPEDLDKYHKNRELEEQAIRTCKHKILKHKLKMNLVDAEYQLDHSKFTFYFTADERVDFRKLVRDLAGRFRTRIELRQIGVRDAARHVGGYGACGCQLCCSLFLKRFENITTQYIKDQLIPMSPSRLTGVCGRLKCCLAYERDFYLEEIERYPTVGKYIQTPKGKGRVEKIDIFNAVIYVRYPDDDIVSLPLKIIEENGRLAEEVSLAT